MKAVCWQGAGKVGVESVPDPKLINPRDAIIAVSSTAICGSDLHLYGGSMPTMMQGDILGHEFMGEVVEVGPAVKNLRIGDRVVVPFNIACGGCLSCHEGQWSLCDNSNPNAWALEKLHGKSSSGLFGYSHLYGGYAGGQAEYVRVPYADVGPLPLPAEIADDKVLFLSDILSTGWMAAENCDIRPGQIVAVWGLGPVGLLAAKSALLLGADRVIGIDRFQDRLQLAQQQGIETIDYAKEDVHHYLMEKTGGMGPDACIDAVGMEAHGFSLDAWYDTAKRGLKISFDKLHALRQAVRACRKGGVISIPGVYTGLVDKFNLGTAFAKGLTFRMGQTHTHRYMQPLLERIVEGQIDPSFVISHRLSLEDAPHAYEMFQKKQDHCTKVVLKPGMKKEADKAPVVH